MNTIKLLLFILATSFSSNVCAMQSKSNDQTGNDETNWKEALKIAKGITFNNPAVQENFEPVVPKGRAEYFVGCFYFERNNYEKAFEYFLEAAKQGCAEAQCDLGTCYVHGLGVKADIAKAILWFKTAANQGLATAQCNLGCCYQDGSGVEKDTFKAFTLFLNASKQNHGMALYQLGKCFHFGMGTYKDATLALDYLKQAAKQGLPEAKEFLEKHYGQYSDELE